MRLLAGELAACLSFTPTRDANWLRLPDGVKPFLAAAKSDQGTPDGNASSATTPGQPGPAPRSRACLLDEFGEKSGPGGGVAVDVAFRRSLGVWGSSRALCWKASTMA
jgi:hypothetical protein